MFKKIFKALYAGKSLHLQERKPCQDYADYRLSKDGYLVLCLSDGAGSALYSELGAFANVNSVLNLFQMLSVDDFLKMSPETRAKTIIRECNSFIDSQAIKYRISDIAQLSATLTVAIVTPEKIYVGHIGDGLIAAKQKGSDLLQYLSNPDNIGGESTRTYFTCSRNAESHYYDELYDTDDYSSLLLCSDGPYNDIQNSFGQDLDTVLISLMGEVEDEIISNDIAFSRRIMQIGQIKDDWSIMVVSLLDGNIVRNTQ